MTPLMIYMMLHFNTTRDTFPKSILGSTAYKSAIDDLLGMGMIRKPTMEEHEEVGEAEETCAWQWTTTEKGDVYVRAVCAVPIPVPVWVMPSEVRKPERPRGLFVDPRPGMRLWAYPLKDARVGQLVEVEITEVVPDTRSDFRPRD